jgi:peptidoglycan/xylan/chitin deacetylase (PgdA/CDA1 family)
MAGAWLGWGAMMCLRALTLWIVLFLNAAAHAAQCSYESEKSFLSRVVAVDSSNGPVYRVSKSNAEAASARPLELRPKEVVLTFDQGPHRDYTQYILDILDHHCAKATFFFTGSAALANPAAVRDVAGRGHTLAAGPWTGSARAGANSAEGPQVGIEKSFAAIAKASGSPVAPFFRAPAAGLPPGELAYLKKRGVSLWYMDFEPAGLESSLSPTQLANRTLLRIREMGHGVIEFHDTRKVTVDALDSILSGLKLSGFKVVHIVPAASISPKDEYLASIVKPGLNPAPSHASRKLLEMARRRVRQDPPAARHEGQRHMSGHRRVMAEQEGKSLRRAGPSAALAGEQR